LFFELFVSTLVGILKVFFIGIIGASIFYGTKIKESYLDVLSAFFVRIALPCLIFKNLATNFRPGEIYHWWIFPLLGISLFFAGGILAYAYTKMDSSVKHREIFISSVVFHNSIILPLAIAPVLFSPEKLETFLSYLFLYNLLTVPAFFTAGVWLMKSAVGEKMSITNFVNPPNAATILGLAVGGFGLLPYIPEYFMEPVSMFGSLTTPISMIIVGGIIITSIPKVKGGDWADPIKVMILKSFVLPSIACALVCLYRPSENVGLFIIIGASMPVGSTLAVICPANESIRKQLAGNILLSSLASIFAVAIFMSIYSTVY